MDAKHAGLVILSRAQVAAFLLPGGSLLSPFPQTLDGDVPQPVRLTHMAQVEAEFGPELYPVHTSGKFRHRWFLAWTAHGKSRSRLAQFWFYVRHGVQLRRQQPFDCIVAYSPNGNRVDGPGEAAPRGNY
jgi:hypothetical protein